MKEKLLAAHHAGLSIVVLPAANKKDLADVPESVLVSYWQTVLCIQMTCYLLHLIAITLCMEEY